MSKPRTKEQVLSHKRSTQKYRNKARASGGLIVYAMVLSPEAVEAWHELKKIHGTNRDVIEDALITTYEQMKDHT